MAYEQYCYSITPTAAFALHCRAILSPKCPRQAAAFNGTELRCSGECTKSKIRALLEAVSCAQCIVNSATCVHRAYCMKSMPMQCWKPVNSPFDRGHNLVSSSNGGRDREFLGKWILTFLCASSPVFSGLFSSALFPQSSHM